MSKTFLSSCSRCFLLTLWFTGLGTAAVADEHADLIAQANASVADAQALAAEDPQRPIYHLMSAAWCTSDPNGPVWYNGEYHVFFQHNPYSNERVYNQTSWGHVASKDMVHWRHLPVALTPVPGTYDKDGCFSGCCVINNGVPTIVYTGNSMSPRQQLQCLATSADDMVTWNKYAGNPVVSEYPLANLVGFRDPFVWKEEADNMWYMLVGSGISGIGPTLPLYKSADLIDWEYMHPLCEQFGLGMGTMWECPNLFPLGDKHVLVISTHGWDDVVKYSVGTYSTDTHKFTPGTWHKMDLAGSRDRYYAASSMQDNQGRRIIWGWIRGGGTEGSPWNGCLTLPRVLTLRPDGRLDKKPAPELQQLRGNHWHFDPLTLTPESVNVLPDVAGDCLEILVEFELGDADTFGLKVRCSADGNEKTLIFYDQTNEQFVSGPESSPLELLPGEDTLSMHIFLDKSVMEVFINGRECMTSRIYPLPTSLGLDLFALGGSVNVTSLDIWQMGTIWVSPEPPRVGDANHDGVVNDVDASILAAHWQTASGATWEMGDFNADGAVNDADASLLAANWQSGVPEQAVPEPSTLMFVWTGLLVLAIFAGTVSRGSRREVKTMRNKPCDCNSVSRLFASLLTVTCVLGTLSGCGGGGGHDYPTARLEGCVTVDGKPLGEGLILFMPQQKGQGRPVKAEIQPDGRYLADKVPVGKVLVQLNALHNTGRMIWSEQCDQNVPEQINLIPQQYRSGIELDVSGDKMDEDFQLIQLNEGANK